MTPVVRRALAAAAVAAALVPAVPARAGGDVTQCAFAGPAGTFRAMRLSIAEPADDLVLTLAPAAAGTRVAAGVVVVDLASMRVVAARVANDRAALRHAGFVTSPGLAPGEYAVVAFGADGDDAQPNPWWRAELLVSGLHPCTPTGSGRTFDFTAADFRSGPLVVVGPAVYADGAVLTQSSARRLVVGLVDASGGPGGRASVSYSHPSGQGAVRDGVAPFATGGGTLRWTLDALGAVGTVDIAGVEVDLP